ncbi:mechanosensitive ion channel [Candidatus Parcubacteria bacterium]|nr:mechanosensitive ion channel [Candidatus Parcubacteria bacterium]
MDFYGIKIICILIAAFLSNRFLRVFIERIIKKRIGDKIKAIQRKRVETLTGILGTTLKFTIWITAFLMILPEFGINIAPILAGAGLIGLAVGMASKDIISSFISGFFIILEDQYNIGDRVKIAGIEGEVKEITLRKTIIKDEKGVFHFIPNNQVKTVSKKIN